MRAHCWSIYGIRLCRRGGNIDIYYTYANDTNECVHNVVAAATVALGLHAITVMAQSTRLSFWKQYFSRASCKYTTHDGCLLYKIFTSTSYLFIYTNEKICGRTNEDTHSTAPHRTALRSSILSPDCPQCRECLCACLHTQSLYCVLSAHTTLCAWSH